ncbi:MAG: response regulator transcription factor [Porticoccaceae bacterium]|nr:response regulator transcription factor [Porticoccaceae bacterium]
MGDDYLIVDDDQLFAETLARSLVRRGHTARIALDGPRALALCRQQPPRRIILDLKLEHASGLQLIGDLRQAAAGTRIVVLTGYSSIPTTVEAIKLGAVDYLCKPASLSDIVGAFERDQGNPAIDLPASPHSVDRLEWEHIQRVLAEHDGNISATARALGMHRRTLQRKLQKRPVRG